MVEFKYWDSKHRMRQRFRGKVADVNWKSVYTQRRKIELETTTLLDSIVNGQVNRIAKFKQIADFGYDAKDILLQHCHTDEEADDALARR